MSVIQEPGGTRPGRAAGLLLIGIAVIAVVLGVITLLDGGDENNGGPPPSSTGQQPPPPSGSQPGGNQPPGQSTSQSPPPVTTTTTEQPAPPPPPQVDPKSVPVRVFNNSTIPKFAATAANDFRNEGWNVVEVGNYSESIIPTTTAYFRPGTSEEAAARALATRFNLKVEQRPASFRYGDGVIVMITKDYGSK